MTKNLLTKLFIIYYFRLINCNVSHGEHTIYPIHSFNNDQLCFDKTRKDTSLPQSQSYKSSICLVKWKKHESLLSLTDWMLCRLYLEQILNFQWELSFSKPKAPQLKNNSKQSAAISILIQLLKFRQRNQMTVLAILNKNALVRYHIIYESYDIFQIQIVS